MKKITITAAATVLAVLTGHTQKITITGPSTTGSTIIAAPYTVNYSFNYNFPPPPPPLPAPPPVRITPQHINALAMARRTAAFTPSPATPAISTFTEFGDGSFTFDEAGMHTYNSNLLSYPVIAKTTGIYDEGTRPPRHMISSENLMIDMTGASPMAARSTGISGVLDPGQWIKITPNINSIVPGDPMVFVVTYKLPPEMLTAPGNLVIRFYYNNISGQFAPVINHRSPVTGITTVSTGAALSVPWVRNYAGETIADKTSQKAEFGNMLEAGITNKDDREHSIFITLIPNSSFDLSEMNGSAQFVAEIRPATNTTRENKDGIAPVEGKTGAGMEDNLTLPSFATSHDPNYVIITERCNRFPKTGKLLNFHVHCENEGKGRASKVVMHVRLPGGITAQEVINYGKMTAKGPNNNTGTWSSSHPDILTITFNPVNSYVLEAADPKKPFHPNTMADAWFTIPANESMHNLVVATADIIFFNTDPTQSENLPVTTNPGMARFSDCCDCNKKKECGCKKTKNNLWRWLFCKKC